MITVNEALKQLAEGRDFDSLSAALMDLSPEQATKVPSGCPYSIATIVHHMWFWQDRWIKQIAGTHCEPFTDDSSDFEVVAPEDWIATRDKLIEDFGILRERSLHTNVFEKPTQFGDTVENLLVRASLHAAYHVGQIVLLRHLI